MLFIKSEPAQTERGKIDYRTPLTKESVEIETLYQKITHRPLLHPTLQHKTQTLSSARKLGQKLLQTHIRSLKNRSLDTPLDIIACTFD